MGGCRSWCFNHVAELTDLDEHDMAWLMRLVARVERIVREVMTPDKVNLAAFGNMVPHLHWHIIPRYRWDSHFPEAIWAAPQRTADTARVAELADRLSALRQWDLDEEEAIRNEMRGGLDVIASGETLSGATRFASGIGRHGAFGNEVGNG